MARSSTKSILLSGIVVIVCTVLLSPSSRPSSRFPNIGLREVGDRLDLSHVVFTLRRTPCVGRCPVYSIELHGSGRGSFEGQDFVVEPGLHVFSFDHRLLISLLETSEQTGFFNTQYQCGGRSNHAGYIELELTTSAGTARRRLQDTSGRGHAYDKESSNRFHFLAEDLADRIDQIANAERWIGTQDERRAKFVRTAR